MMLVVIANNLPPAVRGRMKLWFIEPRSNVFVSGIKDSVAESVIEYLYQYCPEDSGLLIFRGTTATPGYKISTLGESKRRLIEMSGLQCVIDNNIL